MLKSGYLIQQRRIFLLLDELLHITRCHTRKFLPTLNQLTLADPFVHHFGLGHVKTLQSMFPLNPTTHKFCDTMS